MGLRKKSKNPAVLSHEFVIQNHADIVSCVAMVILLGLMFEITAKFAIMFITVQYNVTYTNVDEEIDSISFYEYGFKDLATIFFYMLIAIILHAVIQEYILDKINRRLHLSKTKHSKFNESGQLAFFYLFSFIWGASILTGEKFTTDPTLLWEGYPHTHMFLHRLGLILLVPHYLVELLFHASRLFYFSDENKQKGFTLWALLFVMARLLTLTFSVLTFGFGLARAGTEDFSVANGNFNTLTVRISCLGAICLTQAWMMWKFINFQLKKWREHTQNQIPRKKVANTKSKPSKKEYNKANASNGTVKTESGTSPRARKAKTS
ncbi:translocating chain-associated membrane protein 1-like 1 isoform X2 [Chiloscyllium plagiosum]|uniref:translocating chain-associated membrane protein 1-like 1 isoform X2 n=1 Tax=Chiloscyllium plagiosum TaxID=36176 RepID=UPI001CB83754|nr:translocating chain-associated membrane protein 1-like 1 isoform X2 [Chiloscyllium plagiosum]